MPTRERRQIQLRQHQRCQESPPQHTLVHRLELQVSLPPVQHLPRARRLLAMHSQVGRQPVSPRQLLRVVPMLPRVARLPQEPLQAGLIQLLKCELTPMPPVLLPVLVPCLFRREPNRQAHRVLMHSPEPPPSPEPPCRGRQPLLERHRARCRVQVVFLVDQAAEAYPNSNKAPPKMPS